jgi:hypothetical protein
MTQAERPTFRVVVCLHCKASIPVPTIVAGTGQASAAEGYESQGKSQVFNLRCPSCHKEKPYRTREIIDVEGTPEATLAEERPAPLSWYPQGGNTRAAKA